MGVCHSSKLQSTKQCITKMMPMQNNIAREGSGTNDIMHNTYSDTTMCSRKLRGRGSKRLEKRIHDSVGDRAGNGMTWCGRGRARAP